MISILKPCYGFRDDASKPMPLGYWKGSLVLPLTPVDGDGIAFQAGSAHSEVEYRAYGRELHLYLQVSGRILDVTLSKSQVEELRDLLTAQLGNLS